MMPVQPEVELIKRKNRELIETAIARLDVINYDTVSQLLPKLLAEGLLSLDSTVYEPFDPGTTDPKGVGRHLVYDYVDKDNPFSIWAFAIAPGQKTSIHDHKYRGTVTVIGDAVSEKYYQPTSDRTARRVDRADRYRFHSSRDELTDTFVHQLKRRKALGAGTSVTLHIYDMPAYVVNPQNEAVDRRNFDKIYLKDKEEYGDSAGKGPYLQLHGSKPRP